MALYSPSTYNSFHAKYTYEQMITIQDLIRYWAGYPIPNHSKINTWIDELERKLQLKPTEAE